MSPEFAKAGKDAAASNNAACVKKFAPEQAGLLIFGKKLSKSDCENHAPIPLPAGTGLGVGVGTGDGAGVGVGAGVAVVEGEGPEPQPAAFQVDFSLQCSAVKPHQPHSERQRPVSSHGRPVQPVPKTVVVVVVVIVVVLLVVVVVVVSVLVVVVVVVVVVAAMVVARMLLVVSLVVLLVVVVVVLALVVDPAPEQSQSWPAQGHWPAGKRLQVSAHRTSVVPHSMDTATHPMPGSAVVAAVVEVVVVTAVVAVMVVSVLVDVKGSSLQLGFHMDLSLQ